MSDTSTTNPTEFKFTKLQLEWLEALESGQYEQCEGKLYDGTGYCCLGVAERIRDPNSSKLNPERPSFTLDDEGVNAYSLIGDCGELKDTLCMGTLDEDGEELIAESLAVLNDSFGWTFKQIAEFIRENPEQVFTNGA